MKPQSKKTEAKPKGALEVTVESNKTSAQNTGSDQRVARGIYFGDSDEDENAKSAKENSEAQTQYFKPVSKSEQEQRLNENLSKSQFPVFNILRTRSDKLFSITKEEVTLKF